MTRFRLFFGSPAPADSGITGTLSKTEANDTASAGAGVLVQGALSKTEANDTLSAAGAVGSYIYGSLNATEANDTISAAGTMLVEGTLAKTDAVDTLSAAIQLEVLAALAATEANDTLTSSAKNDSPIVEEVEHFATSRPLDLYDEYAEIEEILAALAPTMKQRTVHRHVSR